MQLQEEWNYPFEFEIKRFSNKASGVSNPQSRSLSVIVSFNSYFQGTDYHYIDTDSIQSQKDFLKEMNSYANRRNISVKNFMAFPIYRNNQGVLIPEKTIINDADLSLVGFVFYFKKDLRELFKIKKISKNYHDKTFKLFEDEIELYNSFLNDDIWLIVVTRPHGKNFLAYGRHNIEKKLNEISKLLIV